MIHPNKQDICRTAILFLLEVWTIRSRARCVSKPYTNHRLHSDGLRHSKCMRMTSRVVHAGCYGTWFALEFSTIKYTLTCGVVLRMICCCPISFFDWYVHQLLACNGPPANCRKTYKLSFWLCLWRIILFRVLAL